MKKALIILFPYTIIVYMADKGTTKLTLSVEKIENHKFPHAPRGYDAFEVDKFLDIVIKDYLLLEESKLVDGKELERAKREIQELREKNDELLLINKRLEAKIPDMKNQNVNEDNIKILKRIDALEKYLWKQGINPDKIK